ncbi:MAG TPA: hypothetical protein VJ646_04615 [Candidatus Binatia bacterium]|nr:hypothetical protein [Candidatus Binatia bacterium]
MSFDPLSQKPETSDRRQLWSDPLILAIYAGMAVFALYAWNRPNTASSIAVALIIAASALAVGSIIGFLFGIPRVAQAQVPTQSASSGAQATQVDFLVNTNLEQISDWLTKIIVGLGLVQLAEIPTHFMSVASFLAQAFGPPAVPSSLVAAALSYFGACGFLIGYLWTRLFLTLEFSRVERAARESPEYYEGMIHALLYQAPPGGFEQAIKLGEDYLKRFGEANYRLWEYLACAYAQKHSHLRRVKHASDDDLNAVKQKALEATETVLQLNPAERESMKNLWDREHASPQEDDLAEFFDDEQFKKLFTRREV